MLLNSKCFRDAKNIVFVASPEKGPVLVHFNKKAEPKSSYLALKEVAPFIKGEREGLKNPRLIVSFSESAVEDVLNIDGLQRLVSTFGIMGFQVSGLLEGSSHNDEISEFSDVPVVKSSVSYADFLNYADFVRKEEELKEEEEAWTIALEEDSIFNFRRMMNDWNEAIKEDEAISWVEAIKQDESFNYHQMMHAWDLALIMDRSFMKRKELEAWELALEQDYRFEKARESKDWDEAIAENIIFEKQLESRSWDEAELIDRKINVLNHFVTGARSALISGDSANEIESLRSWVVSMVGGIEDINRVKNIFDKVVGFSELPASLPSLPLGNAVKEVEASRHVPDIATLLKAQPVTGRASFMTHQSDVLEAPLKLEETHKICRDIIRSGMSISSKLPVIAFSRVSPDAEIHSDESIELKDISCGRFFAGCGGNTKATIVFHNFGAQLVSIAGVFAVMADMTALKGRRVKFSLVDGQLVYSTLP